MAKLIGTGPNQVPTNADLGTMAYQDYDQLAPSFYAGRRNLVINGDFQVSQRGDFTSATTLGNSMVYYVDRWRALESQTASSIEHIISQLIGDGSYANSLKLRATANGASPAMQQYVEDYKVVWGRTFVVSFWYRSNNAWTYNMYNGATQYHYQVPSSDNQWKKHTNVVTFPSNGTELRIEIYRYNAPTSLVVGDFFEFTQFQLELGKVATPFEHRSYGEELARCQRYFERRGTDVANWEFISDAGQLTSATNYQCAIRFNEQMRAPPTMSVTGTVSNLKVIRASVVINVTGITASDNANGRTLLLYGTCASSGGAAGEQTRIQTAVPGTWVNFDAEL